MYKYVYIYITCICMQYTCVQLLQSMTWHSVTYYIHMYSSSFCFRLKSIHVEPTLGSRNTEVRGPPGVLEPAWYIPRRGEESVNGNEWENIGNIMGKWWETVDEWENSENIMLINGTPFNNEWFKGDHKKPHVKNLWRSAFQMNQLSQSFDMDELESMESMEWMFTPQLEVDALPGWAMPAMPAMFRSAPSGLFAVPLEGQPGLPRSPCSDSGWKQSGPSCSHVRREAIASKAAAWDGTACPVWWN